MRNLLVGLENAGSWSVRSDGRSIELRLRLFPAYSGWLRRYRMFRFIARAKLDLVDSPEGLRLDYHISAWPILLPGAILLVPLIAGQGTRADWVAALSVWLPFSVILFYSSLSSFEHLLVRSIERLAGPEESYWTFRW